MESNIISSAFRKKIGCVQTNVEQRLQPETDTSINKILGVNAKAYVDSIEVLSGEATYEAQVTFSVIYLDENNETLMMTQKQQVVGKFEDNSLNSLMQPLYKIEVVDVSIENATSTEVKVQATLELCLDVIDSVEIEPFVPVDENILVKKELKKFLTVIDAGKANFIVSDEFDYKQNINKILLKDVALCVKEVSSGTGYFTVEGDVYVKAYLEILDGETKTYKQFVETLPFKEEIDAERITKNSIVKLVSMIKYDDVSISLTGDEVSNHIVKVDVPVFLRYVALNEVEYEMPADAYSLNHKLNMVTDTYYVGCINSYHKKEHIDGKLEISPELPQINKVLMLDSPNLNITNSYLENDLLKVEGVLTTSVIYKADDELETTNSVQMEVPFMVSLNLENCTCKEDIFVCAEVVDYTVKAKKGKDLELDADVHFAIDNFSKEPDTFIKDVVLTEEILKSPYSLKIYLAPQGSTLWDISKNLNVKEEVILSQNPNLTFPLEKTESIVYFNNK